MTSPTTGARGVRGELDTKMDHVLVLVGDSQRARVVRPGAADTLDVLWEAYATTPDVRPLDQAPDITRNSKDADAPRRAENNAQFAHDVSDGVRVLTNERPGLRLVVIAPPSFADALKADLGPAWPSRSCDVIHRDETKLDDAALRFFIKTTLDAHP